MKFFYNLLIIIETIHEQRCLKCFLISKSLTKNDFSSHLKFFFSEMIENLTRQNEEKSAQTEGMFFR